MTMTTEKKPAQPQQLTKKMVYTALMTALVFISTYAIKVPVPFTSGYIHPGDSMVFLSGLLLGPAFGAFAAGVGSAFADLLGGYTLWIVPTLIIKALMGCIIGFITQYAQFKLRNVLAGIFGGIWILFTTISLLFITQSTEGSSLFISILNGLSEESGMEMASSELIDLLAKTSHYLIYILIGVPLLIGVLLYIQKIQKRALPIHISLSYIMAGSIMVIGYYLAYGLIVSNFLVPIFSIPSNMLQFIGGFIIASFLTPVVLYIKKGLYTS